ncbi:MAG: glycosyltransferase [Verrucomicrobia bacterium]|nr:glycosyltransferase [Verrucomicrobiota bacterium]
MKTCAHKRPSAPFLSLQSIFAKVEEPVSRYLSDVPPVTPRRKKKTGRLAHVVTQVIDAGHAPSRLLRTLLRYHTQPVYLLSNEAHVLRALEPQAYLSEPSWVRGPETLFGLPRLWIEQEFTTYKETAERIAAQLREWEIDIAVFHGAHPLQLYTAYLSDVPKKVFFDHGSLPPEGIFDQLISCLPIQGRSERVDVIPFVIEPPPRGAQERLPLLTTLSNHLDTRLTPPMQEAICAILERCPEAHYVALGDTSLQSFHPRVHFPGHCQEPSSVLGHMKIYLNEFPHGSGLALLDALGAGLPIVSMAGEEVAQSRYGKEFFGFAAHSVEEYVETAVKLLTEEELYRQWSQVAYERFERLGTPQAYVEAIEKAINQ